MEMTKTENIEDTIRKNRNVILKFRADWCGPCKALEPVLDEIAGKNPHITIVSVDTEQNQEYATRYGVKSLPTLIYIQNGEPVHKIVGAKDKTHLEHTIKQYF